MKPSFSTSQLASASEHASTQAAAQHRRMKGHRRTQSNSEIDLKSFITTEHHKSSSDLHSMVDCHQILSADQTKKLLEQQTKSQNTENSNEKQVLIETLDFTPPAEQSNGSGGSMFNFGKKRNYSTGGSLSIYTPPAVKTVNFMLGDNPGVVNRFDLKNEEFFVIPEHQNDLLQSLDFQTGKLQSFNSFRANHGEQQKNESLQFDEEYLNPVEEADKQEGLDRQFGKLERGSTNGGSFCNNLDSDRGQNRIIKEKNNYDEYQSESNQLDLLDFELYSTAQEQSLFMQQGQENTKQVEDVNLRKLNNSMLNTSACSSKPNSRYNYNLQNINSKIQNLFENSQNNNKSTAKVATPEKRKPSYSISNALEKNTQKDEKLSNRTQAAR